MPTSPGTADSSKTYITKGNELIQIADAIRLKTGTTAALEYPEDFIAAIASISPSVSLQDKTVDPSLSAQTVTYDNGYNGLGSVTINAITNVIPIYEGQTN